MEFDEEKLILVISLYPELYDIQNENYMNGIRKNNIWKGIGKEMGVKHTICKEKWKILRDGYHRNVKRRKFKGGDGPNKNKKWKYENQMEFLRPYLQERAPKSNIEINETITRDENITNENSLPDLMTVFPEPVNPPLISSSISSNINAMKNNQTQLAQNSSVSSVLQNYLDSRPATTIPTMESINSIHSFFKAMADSVIALPPDLQLKTKNKIFAILSNAEYENFARNSTSSTGQTATVSKKTRSSKTYDINKQLIEPHSTPRPRPQNIQFQQVQIASHNVQHQIDNIPDTETYNESQSILEIAETIKTEENVNTEEENYSLTPSKKKRKFDVKLRDAEPTLLEKSRQIIDNNKQRNLYYSFGEHVAQKLCSYDKGTRVENEFKISQLLYEADIKMLRPTSSYSNYSSRYSDDMSPNKELYTVSYSPVSERTNIQPQFSNYSPNSDRTDTNTQAENISTSVDSIGIKEEYIDQ
ncbi:uncharacterized protein LOC143913394 [Arctopsyche grandis]|uniref:uncharacterized protein LOC143913394 n=1 Tax=Arctopsyche grandis TaxID=121162 RepID=UPI00406DA3A3